MYVWWGPHIIMKLFQVNINITKEYNTIEKDKICNGSILRGNSTNPPSFWEASKIFLPHATPLFTPTLTALQIQKTLLPSNFRQKGTQLEKRAPIKQNNAYRIVWKNIETKAQRETWNPIRDQTLLGSLSKPLNPLSSLSSQRFHMILVYQSYTCHAKELIPRTSLTITYAKTFTFFLLLNDMDKTLKTSLISNTKKKNLIRDQTLLGSLSKHSIISFIPKIPHDSTLSILYMPC